MCYLARFLGNGHNILLGAIRSPYFTITVFLLVVTNTAFGQEPILEFSGGGYQIEEISEPPFSFHVEVSYSANRNVSDVPHLTCGTRNEGTLLKSEEIEPQLNEADFKCDITGKPLFVDLLVRYNYRDKSGKQYHKERRRILNAFFHLIEPELTSSRTPIKASEQQEIYLFASADSAKHKPLPTGVDVVLVEPSSDCLAFPGQDREKKIVLSGVTGQTSRFPVRANFWQSGLCEVTFKASVDYETHSVPLPLWVTRIQVEPAYLAVFTMVFFGVFSAFAIAGAVQWISWREKATVPSNPGNGTAPPSLKAIFVGDGATKLFSVFVRVAIALLASKILSMDKLGIKADFTSLWGYFTLGFVFGLWPVDKLLQFFKDRLGGPSSESPKEATGVAKETGAAKAE